MCLSVFSDNFLLGSFFFIYMFGSLFACVCASPYVVVFGVLLGVLGVLGVVFFGGCFFSGLLLFLVYLGGMMVVFSYAVSLSADRFFMGVWSIYFILFLGLFELLGSWFYFFGFNFVPKVYISVVNFPTSFEVMLIVGAEYSFFGLLILFISLINCFYFMGGVSGRKSIFSI
nr:NADH dehydrogenase subunit 6 [Rhabdopleura sp. NHMO H2136]